MLIEKQASDFNELIVAVRQVLGAWSDQDGDEIDEIWFRGQPQAGYGLSPGLYRPDIVSLQYDEETLYERFKARAIALTDPRVKSDWDWYFLAQHHGMPTRLLDWTESLSAAVYFSICDRYKDADTRIYIKDRERLEDEEKPCFNIEAPAIWMLDAISLNESSAGPKQSWVFALGGEITNNYLPDKIEKEHAGNRHPISILPSHTNQRIVAQQGVFTVHGYENISLDALANSDVGKEIRLAKIVLDQRAIPQFWDDIQLLGVNRFSLFPDLDSLAYWTKWSCQDPE